MRKILLLLAVLPIGCGPDYNQIDKERTDSMQLDSILLVREQRENKSDSISESFALGTIKFGLSKKEFSKQSEVYLSKLYNPKELRYKIGNYGFISMVPSYYKGKLYQVVLNGVRVNYDKYTTVTTNQYSSLRETLFAKFQEPVKEYDLPKWGVTETNYWYPLCIWNKRNKTIEIRLITHGTHNSIDLVVYQSDLAFEAAIETTQRKHSINREAAKDL